MTTTHDNSPLISKIFADASTIATNIAAKARRFHSNRQSRLSIERLLTYDDRMLDDMGITRSDIERALAGPITENPAMELARLRADRQNAKRQCLS